MRINAATGTNPFIDFYVANAGKANLYWSSTNARMEMGANFYITGTVKTGSTSTNYVVGTGSAITVNTGTPTTVASVTITTVGKPVFILCTADLQPVNSSADWVNLRIYRDASAIGNAQVNHPGTFASANESFAIHALDTPGAGTYTYTCKAWLGNGAMQFGEVGVPYITAWEFI